MNSQNFKSIYLSAVSLLAATALPSSAQETSAKTKLTPEQQREVKIQKLEAEGKTVVKVEDLPKSMQSFINLDDDKKKTFTEHMEKTHRYFQQQRIIEALQELKKAEKIHSTHPNLLNLRGSCFVHLRDFKAAEKDFNKALKSNPNSPQLLFNIAEMHFVTKRWQTSYDKFTSLNEILTDESSSSKDLKRLVEFKRLLSLISLNRIDEATELRDKYDIWDDSPFHYYAQASLEYKKDNKIESDNWLKRARNVFRQAGVLAGWDDTLTEYGYIKSFYGNDSE